MKTIIMKSLVCNYIIVILMIINFSSLKSNAQSLTEKLGGVKTDFIFITDSTEMNIVDQAILKRGVKNYSSGTNYAYGYGFQTYHLEFMTTSNIKEIKYQKRRRRYYKIELLAENDSLLYSFDRYSLGLIKASSKSDLKAYSIDLYYIPIILFEHTKKIKIVYNDSLK